MAERWPKYSYQESRSGHPPRYKVTVTSTLRCGCTIVGRGHRGPVEVAKVAAVNRLTEAFQAHDCTKK